MVDAIGQETKVGDLVCRTYRVDSLQIWKVHKIKNQAATLYRSSGKVIVHSEDFINITTNLKALEDERRIANKDQLPNHVPGVVI